jgi:hypothetical protein
MGRSTRLVSYIETRFRPSSAQAKRYLEAIEQLFAATAGTPEPQTDEPSSRRLGPPGEEPRP